MAWWKEYALSVIGCVLFYGITSQIVCDIKYKKVIKLVFGTLLAITLLGPLPSISADELLMFDMERFSPEIYIDLGRQEAEITQEEHIKEVCESYILNKANELGINVRVNIDLNENLYPNSARIYARSDTNKVQMLTEILEKDLGITKENQTWIWNQEKISS